MLTHLKCKMFLKKAFCSLLMQLFKSILLKAGKYIIHPTSTFHGQSFNPLLTKATQQFFVHHHSKKQELKQKSVQVQDFCLTTKLTLLLSQSYAEDNMAVIEMKRSRGMYPVPCDSLLLAQRYENFTSTDVVYGHGIPHHTIL